MIQGIRSKYGVRGMIARLGNGTVRVRQYLLAGRYGGQLELTVCNKTKIGAKIDEDMLDVKPGTNKIVLDFSNVESLDVVIEGLLDLRDQMRNGA